MKKEHWRYLYKGLAIFLVFYALVRGLTGDLTMGIESKSLGHSIRNVFFHVPLWFSAIVLMTISVVNSIRFLRYSDPDNQYVGNPLYADIKARESAKIGSLFLGFGLATGIVWSRVSWIPDNVPLTDLSSWWGWDPVQISALLSILIYMAYFLLRSSFSEPTQKAKFAAVYNIFAFAVLIPLLFIVPRMNEGVHVTAQGGQVVGGNLAVGGVNNQMRLILYPGMLGFVLLSVWVYEIRSRLGIVSLKIEDQLDQEDAQSYHMEIKGAKTTTS